MKHQFQHTNTLQWAAAKLPYKDACAHFKCKNCNIVFSHFYHDQPNILKAIKEAGININDCKGGEKECIKLNAGYLLG